MSRPEDQIVFEDLHGVQEDEPVTVDLDVDRKAAGIESAPDAQSVDSDAGNDDDIEFDDLRSADADTQGTEDDDASTVDEDDDYSKKVKARIQREQRAKRKERERAEQADARAQYWENQAKELAKSRFENEKRTLESAVELADQGIERVRAGLRRAMEDGDTEAQVALTEEMTDLKARKARAEASLENLPADGNLEPFDGKISSDGRKTTKSKSDEWMEGHADWYRRAGFERATRLANRLDKEVYDDGFDPSTDEYFKELDKRIKAKMPELYDDLDADADDLDTDDRGTRRGKSVVDPVGGNESRRQRTSGSKVELTSEDFANIRRFGMDPKDPEVLKEYARNKREAELGARQ